MRSKSRRVDNHAVANCAWEDLSHFVLFQKAPWQRYDVYDLLCPAPVKVYREGGILLKIWLEPVLLKFWDTRLHTMIWKKSSGPCSRISLRLKQASSSRTDSLYLLLAEASSAFSERLTINTCSSRCHGVEWWWEIKVVERSSPFRACMFLELAKIITLG